MSTVDMNKIMGASFGESCETIRATFKKTVNIKQYESEAIELTTTLDVKRPLTGIERMIISAILQAQLEYEAYIQLACKNIVTGIELSDRKYALEKDVNSLMLKAEEILGRPADYLLEMVEQQ